MAVHLTTMDGIPPENFSNNVYVYISAFTAYLACGRRTAHTKC
jgi:hypothetical protein